MRLPLFALLLFMAACAAPEPEEAPPSAPAANGASEAVALDGTPLHALPLSPERRAAMEADLDSARAAYAAAPDDVERLIWVGRRLAYLGQYRDAVDVFSEGIARFPDDPRLYRHRGHRYLTLRRFDEAAADLERAAELIEGTPDVAEPDGQPNAAGIPRSTLHTNVWYHLGLAYYLQGRFEDALAAYRRGLAASTNDDMYVATTDWLYMTLRRLGRDAAADSVLATIREDMDLLENHAYHRRLRMYQGALPPDSLLRVDDGDDPDLTFATQGYGVGNWHLYNGRPEEARAVFERVLETGYWPAFGYMAAEADLHRGAVE